MATHTIITRTDDIDGTADADELSFGLDGVSYVIDLSPDNAHTLREFLRPYVTAGRRVVAAPVATSSRRSGGRRRGGPEAEARRAIREWAVGEGLIRPEARGRIPADVITAYESTH